MESVWTKSEKSGQSLLRQISSQNCLIDFFEKNRVSTSPSDSENDNDDDTRIHAWHVVAASRKYLDVAVLRAWLSRPANLRRGHDSLALPWTVPCRT